MYVSCFSRTGVRILFFANWCTIFEQLSVEQVHQTEGRERVRGWVVPSRVEDISLPGGRDPSLPAPNYVFSLRLVSAA